MDFELPSSCVSTEQIMCLFILCLLIWVKMRINITFWCQRNLYGQIHCSQINYENTKFPLFSLPLSLSATHRTVSLHCYYKMWKQLLGLSNEFKARRLLRVIPEKKKLHFGHWSVKCGGLKRKGSTPVF